MAVDEKIRIIEAKAQDKLVKARALNHQNRTNEAIVLLEESRRGFEESANYEKLIEVMNALALAYRTIGNEVVAMEKYLQGMSISYENNLFTYHSIAIYNNIGRIYIDHKEYHKAVEFIETAIYRLNERKSVQELTDQEKGQLIGAEIVSNLNIAECYCQLMKYEQADRHIYMAGEVMRATGNEAKYLYFYSIIRALYFYTIDRTGALDEILPEIVAMTVSDDNAIDYLTHIEIVCKLLREKRNFEDWRKVLEFSQKKLAIRKVPRQMQRVTELWLDYAMALDDRGLYNEKCVEYVEHSMASQKLMEQLTSEIVTNKVEAFYNQLEMDALRTQVTKDQLTGVDNRRSLDEDLKTYYKNGKEKDLDYAMGIIDLDFFKGCNDNYGHIHGDYCLKRVAAIIESSVDQYGKVYRYGGDEFVILFNNVTPDMLAAIAKQIKDSLMAAKINNAHSTVSPYLTVSQGYAIVAASQVTSIEEVYKKADAQLYISKNNGKNQANFDIQVR